ncbi:MAG: hypothetical protein ACRDOD_00010 [Streptosporangiaceae bacterium]
MVLADIGGGLQAFDLDTGEPRWDRVEHDVACTALTVGELDGRMVVVGGDGKGRVRIWELSTGREISGPYLVPELDGGITAIGIVPSWDGGRLVRRQQTRPAGRRQASTGTRPGATVPVRRLWRAGPGHSAVYRAAPADRRPPRPR